MRPMAMAHDTVAAIRQFQILPHGDKGISFGDQHLSQHAPGAFTCKFAQRIVDGLRLTERKNSAISRHGVSLLSGGSGRLDTRLDTPPSINRRHPDSRLTPKRYGINQKTVAKWKQRKIVADLPTGPKEAKSTVLSIEEEAIIVAFRRHTLLPLDDCLYALQPTIPHLTRSSLHRCLQRQGISRLPEVEGGEPSKKKFKAYPIGYFHIDIAELHTAEGKLYLYVAIDRTSKFAFVQLVRKTGRTSASAFLEALIAAVPYKIHTVLTDNGIQFTFPPRYADGPTARYVTHMFGMRCQENGIEHRLTKIKHPWTNGQVERMNRTIKEATVQRYYYDRHDQLKAHLADFINAYNYARRLKTLKGLTPYEYICKSWTSQPERFKLNPLQKMPGLNT